MAQCALSFQSDSNLKLRITEDVAFDGIQNFAGSQYDVNNLQQAIGRDSLFIYDFNFAGMNRSGRVSPWQRLRLSQIDTTLGRYDGKSIRIATTDILRRTYRRKHPKKQKITLLSDKHFLYRRSIERDLTDCSFEHITVSSKSCRNFQNILFSVNHADLLIRKHLAAFTRETISFSKTAGAMCQKYALFMVYKNFMAPQFTKKQVRRPLAHTHSPAQLLGLTTKTLRFKDVFEKRSLESNVRNLNDDWKCFWHGAVPVKHRRQRAG